MKSAGSYSIADRRAYNTSVTLVNDLNRDLEYKRKTIILREATQTDAQAAKACVDAAFKIYIERMGKPPAPMLLDFLSEIAEKHVWLAEADGEVVGVLVQYETEKGFYIDTVAVDPRHQGSGVGKSLLQLAEREALRRGYELDLSMYKR